MSHFPLIFLLILSPFVSGQDRSFEDSSDSSTPTAVTATTPEYKVPSCDPLYSNYPPITASFLGDVLLEAAHRLEGARSRTKSVGIFVIGSGSADTNLILQHLLHYYGITEPMETVRIWGNPDYVTMNPVAPFPLHKNNASEHLPIPSLSSALTLYQIRNRAGAKINICLSPTVHHPSKETEFVSKYYLRQLLSIVDALKVFIMVPWETLNSRGNDFDNIIKSLVDTFPGARKLKRVGLIVTRVGRNSLIAESLQRGEILGEVQTYLENYVRKLELDQDSDPICLKEKVDAVSAILGDAYKLQHQNYEYEYFEASADQLNVAVLWEPERCGSTQLSDSEAIEGGGGIVSLLESQENLYWFQPTNFFKNQTYPIADLKGSLNLTSVFSSNDTEQMKLKAERNIRTITEFYLSGMRDRYKPQGNMSEVLYDYGKLLDSLNGNGKDQQGVVGLMESLNEILRFEREQELREDLLETFAYISVANFFAGVNGDQKDDDGGLQDRYYSEWNIVEDVLGQFESLVRSDPRVECETDTGEKGLVVLGNVVKFSDFMVWGGGGGGDGAGGSTFLCEEKGSKVESVIVVAKDKIYIDRDVQRPGLNLVLMADTLGVVGNRVIDIGGESGKQHETPRANRNETKGGAGSNGLPGSPGGNGGVFLALARSFQTQFYPRNYLTIKASAGNGGPGQSGGHGRSGVNGRNATLEDLPPPETFKGLRIPDEYLSNFTWTMKSYGGKSYITTRGGKGGDGGRGGKGGAGGYPGKMGVVRFMSVTERSNGNESISRMMELTHNLNHSSQLDPGKWDTFGRVINEHGLVGKDGKPGRPGRGGLDGYGFRCSIVNPNTKPEWHECEQVVERRKRGKNGANVKQLNYAGRLKANPQVNYREMFDKGLEMFRELWGEHETDQTRTDVNEMDEEEIV